MHFVRLFAYTYVLQFRYAKHAKAERGHEISFYLNGSRGYTGVHSSPSRLGLVVLINCQMAEFISHFHVPFSRG